MKKSIEVTCRLSDADEVISSLIPKDKTTKDLLVTIPIEVEESSAFYKKICSNNKIVEWDFADHTPKTKNVKEENSCCKSKDDSIKSEEEKDDNIATSWEERIRASIKRPIAFYNFLYIYAAVLRAFPSVRLFTKTWDAKFDITCSSLEDEKDSDIVDEKLLDKCQWILYKFKDEIDKTPVEFFICLDKEVRKKYNKPESYKYWDVKEFLRKIIYILI